MKFPSYSLAITEPYYSNCQNHNLITFIEKQMEQRRSQIYVGSRKNSTYEHEASTREQILGKEEYQTKTKHRKSLDLSESRSSPLQGNVHTSKSIFLDQEYKRQGLKMQQLQSKIIILERELLMERKKNNKLKKIITSKIDKEKELESAYRDIVIELKKEIKINPLCFCKTKNNSEKGLDSKAEQVGDLKLEINISNEEKNQLQSEIQQLKQYLSNLKNDVRKRQEEISKLHQFQAFCLKKQQNVQKQHENQFKRQKIIDKLGKQRQIIEKESKNKQLVSQNQKNNKMCQLKQLIKQSSFELKHDFSDNDKLSAYQQRLDSVQSRQSLRSNQQILKKSQEIKQEYILSTQHPAKEQKKQQNKLQTELFSKPFQQKAEKLQKLEGINEQEPNPVNLNISFKTVHQLQQDSFESIVSQRVSQSWQNNQCSKIVEQIKQPRDSQFKSIVYEPDFSDVSSVSILNKSIKSLNNSEHQLHDILKVNNDEQSRSVIDQLKKQIIKLEELNNNLIHENNRQSERDREAVFKFLETVRNYVNRFGTSINQYGNKHKMNFEAPQINSIAFILSNKSPLNQILPNLSQFTKKSNTFLAHLITNISQVAVSQRKQLQRKLNNINLELYDNKNLLKEYSEQKEILTKRLQQQKSYINKLEYQISELSSMPLESHSLQQKQRNNFIREVMKQKYSERDVKVTQCQAQCQIISFQELKRQEEFIKNVPMLVQKYLNTRNIRNAQFVEINFSGNLQTQFHQIFEKTLTLIDNNKSQVAQQKLVNRKYSLSLRDIGQFPKKVQKPEIDPETYYMMQAQLKFLQAKLADKQKVIKKLQEMIAADKRESLKMEEDYKKILTNQPKKQQQTRRDYFSSLEGTLGKNKEDIIHGQQTPQFREYSEIKEFNNLSLGKEELVKELKEKVEILQKQVGKYRCQGSKKKKIHFLNH